MLEPLQHLHPLGRVEPDRLELTTARTRYRSLGIGGEKTHLEMPALEDLLAAVKHLVDRGAEILILGCTELPVLIDESEAYPIAGRSVVMLDPTNILARRCVAMAQAATAAG